jgi:phage antirepressor YoqD-like protein
MTIDKELQETYFDMSEVANICKVKINGKQIGRNELFKQLRKNKILQEGNNLPYKVYINLGFFRVKTVEIDKPNQYTKTSSKTQVSNRGIQFIKELLN